MHPNEVELRFRPMTEWASPPRAKSKHWSWDTGYNAVLGQLRTELAHLGSEYGIVELDLGHDDIRMDGMPRAQAAPRTPRVALWFEVGGQQRVLRCAAFDKWIWNLKAIGMTLNRNRLAREYGCMSVEAQYRGFDALPSGEFVSSEQAAEYLIQMGEVPDCRASSLLGNKDVLGAVRARAAKRHHPDMGGDQATMAKINRAFELCSAGA